MPTKGELGCGGNGAKWSDTAEGGSDHNSVVDRISDHMTCNMKLGLEECLHLMTKDKNQLLLVLFVQCNSLSSILKFNAAIKSFAQESVRKDGIHLVMLGGKEGINSYTTSFPNKRGQAGSDGASSRMMNRAPIPRFPSSFPRGFYP